MAEPLDIPWTIEPLPGQLDLFGDATTPLCLPFFEPDFSGETNMKTLDVSFAICETGSRHAHGSRSVMHVISRKKLVGFWTRQPAAESPLRVWFRRLRASHWTTFAALRSDFPTADQVGRLTVFNIGGNKFRLIAHIHFNRDRIYIRHVLTHAGYDRGDWKKDL